MPKRILKGIAWDHERGYGVLARTAVQFMAEHSDIEVDWDRRSLRDFGEGPIDVLAERYDLVIFDHPFSGHAHRSQCLVDLKPYLEATEVGSLLADSIGQTTESYHYKGGIYGLPTDAAAQIASYRPDLLAAVGGTVPTTHKEVMALAERARAHGKAIATPACPIDAMCLILTFCANMGAPLAPDSERFVEPAALAEVLGRIEELVAASDPRSLEWNPIQLYDSMSAGDDIVYVPYAFGYSNYARTGRDRLILASNIAGPGPDPQKGALLGGAGYGVTKNCKDIDAAITYARWLHRPEFQKGAYFEHGGQPGLRSAWTDTAVNRASGNFFVDSLETLDKAYLRPRWDNFLPFFEEAGKLTNKRLRGAISRNELIEGLHALYDEAREKRAMSEQRAGRL